jgi:hypothetical protein
MGESPVDIVAALSGSASVTLGGFGDKHLRLGSWTHPSTPFLSAREFDREEAEVIRARAAWKRAIRISINMAIAAAAFALGLFTAIAAVDWRQQADAASMRWSITSISDQGVTVNMDGKTTVIPVGARLPSGELVVSLAPERRAVYLENTIIVLRQTSKKDGAKN